MGEIVTDPFAGTGTGLGANWTSLINSWDRASDLAIPHNTNNADNGAIFTGAGWTGGADQYAEVEIRRQGANSDGGVIVRGQAGSETFYLFDVGDATTVALPGTLDINIYRCNSGSFAQPTNGAGGTMTISVGDILRIEVTGTGATVTIVAKVNGSTVITATDTSGSRLTSGNPGIWCFQHVNDVAVPNAVRNFAAGDFTTPGSGKPFKYYQNMGYNFRRSPSGLYLPDRKLRNVA